MRALRYLLVLDAAVLFVMGGWLIFAPRQTAMVFRFENLPEGVHYILGMWGCTLATLAFGYLAAALDPLRHLIWIQVGIARALLECLLGTFYLARGVLSVSQAGFGIFIAGVIALAYVLLYPRPEGQPGEDRPTAAPAA
jgi:hypothetical protein